MKTLHLIRKTDDLLAAEAIRHSEGDSVVLLIQDGVLERESFQAETYVCMEDARARGIESLYPTVDYEGIAELIATCNRVITW